MLTPWKESCDQPRQHINKQDITLPTNVHLVKAMVFPVVMYGYESWTIKKAELRRIDAFELWCWRRLLRVPWTARRSNQSILKEISPGCSLEGLITETPILWPPDGKSWLIWKDPDARKDWGQEEQGVTEDEMVGWHHWFNGHGFGWTQGVCVGQGGRACCGPWGRKEFKTTEWLNWTELNWTHIHVYQTELLWLPSLYRRINGELQESVTFSKSHCCWEIETTRTLILIFVRWKEKIS